MFVNAFAAMECIRRNSLSFGVTIVSIFVPCPAAEKHKSEARAMMMLRGFLS